VAKTEKRTIAPENENFMISLEREESWLSVKLRDEVG